MVQYKNVSYLNAILINYQSSSFIKTFLTSHVGITLKNTIDMLI